MSSHCTNSDSLPKVGFEPTLANAPSQETREFQLTMLSGLVGQERLAFKLYFPALLSVSNELIILQASGTQGLKMLNNLNLNCLCVAEKNAGPKPIFSNQTSKKKELNIFCQENYFQCSTGLITQNYGFDNVSAKNRGRWPNSVNQTLNKI